MYSIRKKIPMGPYFIKEPVDTIYDPRRNTYVQLTCIAGRIGNLPRKARLSNFDRVLTIPNVGVEDEGEYICDVKNDRARIANSVFLKDSQRDSGMFQCEAKNQLKAKFSSGQLRVLSLKPSFKKHPLESESYGSEGGNVTLRCNPEAAPKPTFTWKKDNIVIWGWG
ncbi:hypothetical protein ACJJTC_018532 [Scirpophaga incertulas]